MKGIILDDAGLRVGEGKEYYASRIERLLFEAEGGVLGYPDWGSRIPTEFLFEPEDETTANEIINESAFLFERREDLLEISSMSVEMIPSNSGANGFAFKIGVLLPDTPDEKEEVVEFFKIVEVL